MRPSVQPILTQNKILSKIFNIHFAFMLCNFSVRMQKYIFRNFKLFFPHKKLKKPPQKVAYL